MFVVSTCQQREKKMKTQKSSKKDRKVGSGKEVAATNLPRTRHEGRGCRRRREDWKTEMRLQAGPPVKVAGVGNGKSERKKGSPTGERCRRREGKGGMASGVEEQHRWRALVGILSFVEPEPLRLSVLSANKPEIACTYSRPDRARGTL